MKRFRNETSLVFRSAGPLTGSAFLAAFAGTLIWVNGRGAWFVMHYGSLPSFALPLTVLYLFWVLAYGLAGISILLGVLLSNSRCNGLTEVLLSVFALFLAYLWYPLFFSAQFVLPALLVLLGSAGLLLIELIKNIRRSLWLTITNILILFIEGYFICLTTYFLLN